MKLILASSSPRRQQMLRDMGLNYTIVVPDIDEAQRRSERAHAYVKRLAYEKALGAIEKAGLAWPPSKNSEQDWLVLAADTIVVYQKKILGKPLDRADALRTLMKLSGKSHEVLTSYCWIAHRRSQTTVIREVVKTKVTFASKSRDFWKWYVETGDPLDKAGSYGAQGLGASFIHSIHGSYSNVIGLPLSHAIATFEKKTGLKFSKKLFS